MNVPGCDRSEIDRINELADELNREAEEVLEYQVIRRNERGRMAR
jgi:hypothetical protein